MGVDRGEQLVGQMLRAIESELQGQIRRLGGGKAKSFHDMLAYHMGWTGRGGHARRAGKRIRPLLVLLVSASVAGDWREALPAAAAVEILHNFSLVHDDIQDNSPTRRGRIALWKKVGIPLAINAGDAFLALANEAALDLRRRFSAETVVDVAGILQRACINLTRGQFLDLAYQNKTSLAIRDYWDMIDGKTASLLSACTQVGALLGGATKPVIDQYRVFGRLLGLAFQVKDDILGIWGDETLTGKSVASDLVERKNSLPVLYGISRKARFAKHWRASLVRPEGTDQLRRLLTEEGAYEYAVAHAGRLTGRALTALRSAKPHGEAGVALVQLSERLLQRQY